MSKSNHVFLRFPQRATGRRGTRRISIHPNFLQRLSNTVSTPSNAPRPSIPTIKIPQGDTPRSTLSPPDYPTQKDEAGLVQDKSREYTAFAKELNV